MWDAKLLMNRELLLFIFQILFEPTLHDSNYILVATTGMINYSCVLAIVVKQHAVADLLGLQDVCTKQAKVTHKEYTTKRGIEYNYNI